MSDRGSALSVAQFWVAWQATPSWEDNRKSLQEGLTSTLDVASGILDTAISNGPSEWGARAQGSAADLGATSPFGTQCSIDLSEHLCPLLMVDDPEGTEITIGGLIHSTEQQDIFEVHAGASDKTEIFEASLGVDKVLLRVYLAEGERTDNGILLESALGVQMAFLDTRFSFNCEDPYVSIISPGDDLGAGVDVSLQAEGRSASAYTWGTVTRPNGSCAHVRRSDGELILIVLLNPSLETANITDSSGRLIGVMNVRQNTRGQHLTVIQVASGWDAGLMLCGVMASMKLSESASQRIY